MDGKKRLRLSRTNKIIGGVCGGIAEFFNVDPSIVRIIVTLVTIVLYKIPFMIILYIVCWAVIPSGKDSGGDYYDGGGES